jgi:hypothetical protein
MDIIESTKMGKDTKCDRLESIEEKKYYCQLGFPADTSCIDGVNNGCWYYGNAQITRAVPLRGDPDYKSRPKRE